MSPFSGGDGHTFIPPCSFYIFIGVHFDVGLYHTLSLIHNMTRTHLNVGAIRLLTAKGLSFCVQ